MTEGDGEPDRPYPVAGPQGEQVHLHPATRIAWREREDTIDVFIDGGHCEVPLNALRHLIALCSGEWIQRGELALTSETLFETLCEAGALADKDST